MISVSSNDVNSLIYDYLTRLGLFHSAHSLITETKFKPQKLKYTLEEVILLGAQSAFLKQHQKKIEELQISGNFGAELKKICVSNFNLMKEHFCFPKIKYIELMLKNFKISKSFAVFGIECVLVADNDGRILILQHKKGPSGLEIEILAEENLHEKLCKIEVIEELNLLLVCTYSGEVRAYNLLYLLFNDIRPEFKGQFSHEPNFISVPDLKHVEFPAETTKSLLIDKGPVFSITNNSNKIMLGTFSGVLVQLVLSKTNYAEIKDEILKINSFFGTSEFENRKNVLILKLALNFHKSSLKLSDLPIFCISYVNKAQVSCGLQDGSLALVDLKTKDVNIFKKHKSDINSCKSITLNGTNALITSSMDGCIALWTFKNSEIDSIELEEAHKGGIVNHIIDTGVLITAGLDGFVKFFEVDSLVLTKELFLNFKILKMHKFKKYLFILGLGGSAIVCLETLEIHKINSQLDDICASSVGIMLKRGENEGVTFVDYTNFK